MGSSESKTLLYIPFPPSEAPWWRLGLNNYVQAHRFCTEQERDETADNLRNVLFYLEEHKSEFAVLEAQRDPVGKERIQKIDEYINKCLLVSDEYRSSHCPRTGRKTYLRKFQLDLLESVIIHVHIRHVRVDETVKRPERFLEMLDLVRPYFLPFGYEEEDLDENTANTQIRPKPSQFLYGQGLSNLNEPLIYSERYCDLMNFDPKMTMEQRVDSAKECYCPDNYHPVFFMPSSQASSREKHQHQYQHHFHQHFGAKDFKFVMGEFFAAYALNNSSTGCTPEFSRCVTGILTQMKCVYLWYPILIVVVHLSRVALMMHCLMGGGYHLTVYVGLRLFEFIARFSAGWEEARLKKDDSKIYSQERSEEEREAMRPALIRSYSAFAVLNRIGLQKKDAGLSVDEAFGLLTKWFRYRKYKSAEIWDMMTQVEFIEAVIFFFWLFFFQLSSAPATSVSASVFASVAGLSMLQRVQALVQSLFTVTSFLAVSDSAAWNILWYSLYHLLQFVDAAQVKSYPKMTGASSNHLSGQSWGLRFSGTVYNTYASIFGDPYRSISPSRPISRAYRRARKKRQCSIGEEEEEAEENKGKDNEEEEKWEEEEEGYLPKYRYTLSVQELKHGKKYHHDKIVKIKAMAMSPAHYKGHDVEEEAT